MARKKKKGTTPPMKYHIDKEGRRRRCKAVKRPGGRGVTECFGECLTVQDIFKNGGGVTSHNGIETYHVNLANGLSASIGPKLTRYYKDGAPYTYRKRDRDGVVVEDLAEAYALKPHNIPMYEVKDTDPVAWRHHKEIATLIDMSDYQWDAISLKDKKAFTENIVNRFMGTLGSKPFAGFGKATAQVGRAFRAADRKESSVDISEELLNKPKSVALREILFKVSCLSASNLDFKKSFTAHFKSYLNVAGMDHTDGVVEQTPERKVVVLSTVKARAKRAGFEATCSKGHNFNQRVKPTIAWNCVNCYEERGVFEKIEFFQKL